MSFRLRKRVLLDLLDDTQVEQQRLISELNDTEREASGTSAHWSARDHIAHLTFWKQHLSRTLAALARSETPPSKGDTEALNAQVFEEQRERPWSDILLEAKQAHADLLANLEHLTEEDLDKSHWYWLPRDDGEDGSFPEGQPLWSIILSNGYWHLQEHFTQFYLDRNDVSHATQLQEAWTENMMQREVPPVIQSIALCQPAIFYATTNQKAKAQEMWHQALALDPTLTEILKQDADLASFWRIGSSI